MERAQAAEMLNTLRRRYLNDLSAELARHFPEPVRSISERELKPLPRCVQRFIRGSGLLGSPQAANCRMVWRQLNLRTSPHGPWLHLECEQTSFFRDPVRLVLMSGKVGGLLPVSAYDRYLEGRGELLVHLAGVLPVHRAWGAHMDNAELVTYLAEGLMLPSLLLEPNLLWTSIDARSARAKLRHRGILVSGVFSFDEEEQRARFETYDRWRDGPVPTRQRWSAEVAAFEVQEGLRVPRHSSATWHAPEGDFTYMRGNIESITRDIAGTNSRARPRLLRRVREKEAV